MVTLFYLDAKWTGILKHADSIFFLSNPSREMESAFKFKKTVSCALIGDGSEDLLLRLMQEAGLQAKKPQQSNITFHGLRFGDALLCVWHLPCTEHYRDVARAYMQPGRCNVVVVCELSGDEASHSRAKEMLADLESTHDRLVVQCHIHFGAGFDVRGGTSSRTVVSLGLGLQTVGDLVKLLLLNRERKLYHATSESDFDNEEDEMIEIPLDDDDSSTSISSQHRRKQEVLEIMKPCQACMFM